MEKLFSHGTLQMDKVQQETFGRLLTGNKDTLIGYVLSEVRITDPAVIEKVVRMFIRFCALPVSLLTR